MAKKYNSMTQSIGETLMPSALVDTVSACLMAGNFCKVECFVLRTTSAVTLIAIETYTAALETQNKLCTKCDGKLMGLEYQLRSAVEAHF